jgi:hypothetical protein
VRRGRNPGRSEGGRRGGDELYIIAATVNRFRCLWEEMISAQTGEREATQAEGSFERLVDTAWKSAGERLDFDTE